MATENNWMLLFEAMCEQAHKDANNKKNEELASEAKQWLADMAKKFA